MSLDSALPEGDREPKRSPIVGQDPDWVARSVAGMIKHGEIAVVGVIGFPVLVKDVASRVCDELGLSVKENVRGSLCAAPWDSYIYGKNPDACFRDELYVLLQQRHHAPPPLLWVGDLSEEWQRDLLLRSLERWMGKRSGPLGQVPGTLAVHLRRSLKRALRDEVDPAGEPVPENFLEVKLPRKWAEERYRRLERVTTSDLRSEGWSAAVEFGF